MRLVTSTYVGA